MLDFEIVKPREIEARSFEIITEELGGKILDPTQAPIIKRVIHTSADFEYADSLYFSSTAIERGIAAAKKGTAIITDTNMAKAGINKAALARFGGEVHCFMAEKEIAQQAEQRSVTRATVCMEKGVELYPDGIFVIGNAPTALVRLKELCDSGKARPSLVIAVPVGFVNVVQAKELFVDTQIPAIVARGRKGGSNVAAAIVNALLYLAGGRE